ncbi:hypothetical protein BT69DRAFT_386493 [Atractiella rhizophila]|nr:hypothetical protein BT69DRAFT_386493 [Atractiella rhizophila]
MSNQPYEPSASTSHASQEHGEASSGVEVDEEEEPSRELVSRSSPTAERRQQRRTSQAQGPYASVSTQGRQRPRPARLTVEGEGEQVDQQENERGRPSAIAAQPPTPPPATLASQRNLTFEFRVVQQPQSGSEAGFSVPPLGRLPIAPAPVIQLVVREGASGEETQADLDYLICNLALVSEDGETDLVALEQTSVSSTQRWTSLVGGLVSSLYRLNESSGDQTLYFVWPDLAVRVPGRFRLRFTLLEAWSGAPSLASTMSEVFEVYPLIGDQVDPRYPGAAGRDVIATPLTRRLLSQGVRVSIPPWENPPQTDFAPPAQFPTHTGTASPTSSRSRGSTPRGSGRRGSPARSRPRSRGPGPGS